MRFFYADIPSIGNQIERHVFVVNQDGSISSCLADGDTLLAKSYQEWLAEGNTPEPWNPEEVTNGD